jgi:hypothetical protein
MTMEEQNALLMERGPGRVSPSRPDDRRSGGRARLDQVRLKGINYACVRLRDR